ncbi:hypothetical protein [uncultured Streptococcus sp.]|uniref:hypothetical protein n=1 Tax=uncultured Streptococcus sp. TaxID=83427 RepID=UPI001E1A33A7|nr:hypothetical protein [uncultured Streptococcus sp.]HJG94495.1 hypothetical protein [Enterococcus faecalis]
MGKLSPKPKTSVKKLTWSDLDVTLKAVFEENTNNNPSATIELALYEMPKAEIISEAVAQGYEVEDNNDGYLTFK